MPSSIPYNPSLVLGSIVNTEAVGVLKEISENQAATDAAQEAMNSLIMMKRSLAMTANELIDMGIDTSALNVKIGELNKSIADSANAYLATKIKNEQDLQELRVKLYSLPQQSGIVSPLDFTLSKIDTQPLAAESIKMDAQYFRFGSNEEGGKLASIEKYIKEATSEMGTASNDVTKAVSLQITTQLQNHNLLGTLIITASCTHRNVSIITPLILNIENAVEVWNSLQTEPAQRISIENPQGSILKDDESNDDSGNAMTLLSGAAYGSSFVGMVHMLRTDMAAENVDNATIQKLLEKLQVGGWLQNATGGLGVDASIKDDVKRVLSTQSFSSHVSIVTMGTTPSIAANVVGMGLNKIIQTSKERNMALLTMASQSTPSEQQSITAGSTESNKVARTVQVEQSNNKALVKGLAEIDHGTNKMLDINSLMTAFDDYISSVRGNKPVGVPIRYFFTKITRSYLMRKIAEKYKPAGK